MLIDKRIVWRRILLVIMVGCTMYPLSRPVHADELSDVQCPPGDRNDWRFNANKLRAATYEWKQDSQGVREACGNGFTACAIVTVKDDKPHGIIYSHSPDFTLPEWLRQHELCHLKGWSHD